MHKQFGESLLARVGLMGAVYSRTSPPRTAGNKEMEFSSKWKIRVLLICLLCRVLALVASIAVLFHERTARSDEPLPILKYSLLPRLMQPPLRVCVTKRHGGISLSVKI